MSTSSPAEHHARRAAGAAVWTCSCGKEWPYRGVLEMRDEMAAHLADIAESDK